MRKAIYLLLLSLLLSTMVQSASGQAAGTPDCLVPFDTGAGVGASTYNYPPGNGFDNRTLGCVTWTLEWQSNATPTVTFQSSTGVASPSSYGAYTGTTVFSGTGIMTFSNLETGTVVDTPWVRVNVVTGATGQTKGVLFGYRTGTTGGTGGGGGGGGGGSGCPGTTGTPCVVEGVAADGSALAGNPVRMGGSDGTDVRTISTDTSGHTKIIGGIAPGSAASNPVTGGAQNDAGNVVAYSTFPDQGDISVSAATAVKIAAGSSGKLIYIGHVSIALSAGTTVNIVQGTTSSTPCDTSASTIWGPYENTAALALDFDVASPLHTTTTGDDMCFTFGASSTGGGGVVYGQH